MTCLQLEIRQDYIIWVLLRSQWDKNLSFMLIVCPFSYHIRVTVFTRWWEVAHLHISQCCTRGHRKWLKLFLLLSLPQLTISSSVGASIETKLSKRYKDWKIQSVPGSHPNLSWIKLFANLKLKIPASQDKVSFCDIELIVFLDIGLNSAPNGLRLVSLCHFGLAQEGKETFLLFPLISS